MRVIAGIYRSRLLKSLKGQALRPTSDRLRETLFNVLGPAVRGSRFVDVFAGTGAVGIEAISRGASEAVFIENHAAAAALIRRNLKALGILSSAQVLSMDAVRGLQKLLARGDAASARLNFAFIDPPYAQGEDYRRVLQLLGSAAILAADGTVVAEHHRKMELPERFGMLQRTRVLRQGDAALTFYRWHDAGATDISLQIE